MNIIAHRGYSSCFPENTLAAVTAAWKTPAHGVEIDVRLTLDGQVVVIHDSHTARVADKKVVIENATCAELRELNFGMGEKIPLLTDVLQTVPRGRMLFIEPKCDAVVGPLAAIIRKSGFTRAQILFLGFQAHVSMSLIKTTFPDFPVHCLMQIGVFDDSNAEKLIAAAKEMGIDGIQLGHPSGRYLAMIDKKFVRTMKKAGVGLHVWTVNHHGLAQRLLAAGVEGITTDQPERVARGLLGQK